MSESKVKIIDEMTPPKGSGYVALNGRELRKALKAQSRRKVQIILRKDQIAWLLFILRKLMDRVELPLVLRQLSKLRNDIDTQVCGAKANVNFHYEGIIQWAKPKSKSSTKSVQQKGQTITG
jgi:hypothetical protein